jgi:pimeloyl-ACP methyl ester carboxylesterase
MSMACACIISMKEGKGPVVVLLHGNLVTAQDFFASGLFDRLSPRHRVIAFDRPGFGHSRRPRDRIWTPQAQAASIQFALKKLGPPRAVIVGHSGHRFLFRTGLWHILLEVLLAQRSRRESWAR